MNGDCQRHDVWFDSSYTSEFGDGVRESLACHEWGHTVGLKHRPYDCMMGKADPRGNQYPYYDDHSKHEINSNY